MVSGYKLTMGGVRIVGDPGSSEIQTGNVECVLNVLQLFEARDVGKSI